MAKAVVAGGGIAGLLSALRLADLGHQVTVYEASLRFGGLLSNTELAGVTVDLGAESFATRSTAVSDLIQELKLAENLEQPNPEGARLFYRGQSLKLPATSLLGIPTNPFDYETRKIIGWFGAIRASFDSFLKIRKHYENVEELIKHRLGSRVLDRLVLPVLGGVYSANPAQLSCELIATNFDQKLKEHGSLSKLVKKIRANVPPGGLTAGLKGGMATLAEALVQELKQRKVKLVSSVAVEDFSKAKVAAESESSSAKIKTSTWLLSLSTGEQIEAEVLVLATSRLGEKLAERYKIAELSSIPFARTDLVTLAIESKELDSFPFGTGLLIRDPKIKAKALTHSTAKWGWLAEKAGAGKHFIRLSYAPPSTPVADLSDEELFESAKAELQLLSGIGLRPEQFLALHRQFWLQPHGVISQTHQQAVRELLALVEPEPNLKLVGSWVAGSGLAAVISQVNRVFEAW